MEDNFILLSAFGRVPKVCVTYTLRVSTFLSDEVTTVSPDVGKFVTKRNSVFVSKSQKLIIVLDLYTINPVLIELDLTIYLDAFNLLVIGFLVTYIVLDLIPIITLR